jgi:hypothetical protein
MAIIAMKETQWEGTSFRVGMKTSAKLYWLTFVALQIGGFVSLAFGDPHVHVVLKNLGLLLLLPGTLATSVFAEIGVGVDIPLAIVLGGVLLANFGAWYAARRIWLAARSRVRTEK